MNYVHLLQNVFLSVLLTHMPVKSYENRNEAILFFYW